ncbi:MAG TPA: response regulator [Spirochaetota bacterium]|nr:response regulator [Spirochaetota bacterium]HOM37787.1 response regulator [Spirochaetota bacterium]HPQ49336.1 response regulator [Spirochaetota bacterium]
MKRVLVIDDSNVIKANTESIITKNGFEFEHAFDGKEAINILKAGFEPNIIICDINMPNMDGLEFLEWVKNEDNFKFIPVVMLTTETEIQLMQKAKKLGASGWIIKPFDEDTLIEVIKKFIR